jgi:hypothetical protein
LEDIKMKRSFLEDLGLTKEQIDSIMSENGKDINAAKSDYDALKEELESTKGQLVKANETIDGFKDYEEIKGQVADYKQKYEASENEKLQIRQNYEFNGKLETAAKKHGAKALKAVMPYLEIEKLKESKNQDSDIDEAFKALKESEENAFLFGANEPINNPITRTRTNTGGTLDAVAKAMGLTEKDFE